MWVKQPRAWRFAQMLCVIVACGVLGAAQRSPGPRTIVVLSNMNMGIGRVQSGQWHPYEDFRWATEFVAFLKAIDAEGQGNTDLILNGDTFELLQSAQKDCAYSDANLGCTEPEALARLNRVLTAHATEIKALGQFASSGSNRLVLVPGDHDAALLFSSVGHRVLTALATPAGRAEIAIAGAWRSADGQVYAEHGHQIGFSEARFDNWPKPFVRRATRTHLSRPWGEQVIQAFFDRYEERYPIIDNLADQAVGVKYGLSAEGVTDAGSDTPRLLRYLLFRVTWQQFRMDQNGGDTKPAQWDVAQVRAEGPAFLVGSLPDDDRFKPLAAKALDERRLAKSMDELSDNELVMLCDYRAALRRARRKVEVQLTQFSGRGPVVPECPRTPETRGVIFDYFWRSRDTIFTKRLEAVAKQLPPVDRPVTVYVHGHTHLADRSQAGTTASNAGQVLPPEGFSPVQNAFTPITIDDGAWQRTIMPNQLERIRESRHMSDQEVMRSLQPEDLPACYTFVLIKPYTGMPEPAVRFWRQGERSDWAIGTGCGGGARAAAQ